MRITSDEAVRIAAQYGLTMQDAHSLTRLAETPEEAAALARTFKAPRQLSRDDLKTMTNTEILEARAAGQLDELLGMTPKVEAPASAPIESPAPARPVEGVTSGFAGGEGGGGQLTREDLKTMTSAEIVEAKQEGRLSDLMEGRHA